MNVVLGVSTDIVGPPASNVLLPPPKRFLHPNGMWTPLVFPFGDGHFLIRYTQVVIL